MDGILVVDKPAGITSHDVVDRLRRLTGIDKVGHLGTLDPIATGVLPVALGRATRLAQFFLHRDKTYEGVIRFGFATDTYDREGTRTTDEKPFGGNLEEAIRSLTGSLDQIPPPYSAKKIGGVASDKLARRNQAVGMAPSKVEVERFEVVALNPPLMTFRVVCSPGTYIRSLAHDLGQLLGCGAHLTALRRTRSGDFRIQDAVGLDKLSAKNIIPLDRLLPGMPRIEVSGLEETKVVHGNEIRGVADGQFARIFNKKGEFLAVAFVENGWVRPRLVLTSIPSEQSDMLDCILEKEIES